VNNSAAKNGFTLIEVLVALVVVSLGMLGAIEAVNQSVLTSAYLRDKAIAQWVAMNKLTEVRLLTQAPKVDKTSGDAEMAGQKYRWTLAVTKTPIETMFKLDVSVIPGDDDSKAPLASATGFYSTSIARQSSWPSVCQDNPNDPRSQGGANGGGGTGGGVTPGTPPVTSPQTPVTNPTTPPTRLVDPPSSDPGAVKE
jgi:general secretion pathway protein I